MRMMISADPKEWRQPSIRAAKQQAAGHPSHHTNSKKPNNLRPSSSSKERCIQAPKHPSNNEHEAKKPHTQAAGQKSFSS